MTHTRIAFESIQAVRSSHTSGHTCSAMSLKMTHCHCICGGGGGKREGRREPETCAKARSCVQLKSARSGSSTNFHLVHAYGLPVNSC